MQNLAQPWLFARFVLGVSEASLAIAVLVVALRMLARTEEKRSSEAHLQSEKHVELVSTLFSLAALFAWVDLFLAALSGDRLAGSIRGAMCAWGVLHSSPWGFRSLVMALIAALVASVWRAVHAVDLTQQEPRLTRTKMLLACFVAPFFLASFGASTMFAMALDFRVVASCCSTSLGADRATELGAHGGGEALPMIAFVAAGLLASLFAIVSTSKRASVVWMSSVASLASIVAAVFAMPAIVGYVAPHAYETPLHQCPFCLLRVEESGGVGWPLALALALALASSLGVMTTLAMRGRVPEPGVLKAVHQRYARGMALGWLLAVIVALYPVARFAWLTGGAPLFG
jgi:hypothetical protein